MPLIKVVNLKVLQLLCVINARLSYPSNTRQLSDVSVCNSRESVQQNLCVKESKNPTICKYQKLFASINDIKRSERQCTCSLNSPGELVSGWSDRVGQ